MQSPEDQPLTLAFFRADYYLVDRNVPALHDTDKPAAAFSEDELRQLGVDRVTKSQLFELMPHLQILERELIKQLGETGSA